MSSPTTMCMMMLTCVAISLTPSAHAQYTPLLPSSPPPPTSSPPVTYGDTVGQSPLSKDETIALAVGLAIGIPVLIFAAIGCICCLCNNHTRCCSDNNSEDGVEDRGEMGGAPGTVSARPHRRQSQRDLHYSQYLNTQFQVHEGICLSFVPTDTATTAASHSSYTIEIIEPRTEDGNNVEDVATGSVLNTHHNSHLRDNVHEGGHMPTTPTRATAVQPNSNIIGQASSHTRHNDVGEEATSSAAAVIPNDGEIVIYVNGGMDSSTVSSPAEVAEEMQEASAFCTTNPYGTGSYETASPSTPIDTATAMISLDN